MGGKRKWKSNRGATGNSDDTRFDDQIRTEVHDLFQKQFTYKCPLDEKWTLPKSQPFGSEPWEDTALVQMKVPKLAFMCMCQGHR